MPVPSGYLIGRVLSPSGPGPWWTYVDLAATHDRAISEARRLADEGTGQAWLLNVDDVYEAIADTPLPDKPPHAEGDGDGGGKGASR